MTERWLPLGTNFYRIMEDVIEIDLHGPFTMADAQQYVAVLDAMCEQYGYTLTLFNLQDAEPLAPEIRKYLGQYSNQTATPVGIATYGGGLPQRMLGRLIIRGINLLRKTPLAVNFLDDEDEAKAWLGNRRLQIRASAAPKNS